MSDYLTGHVKRDAETGNTALRTIFPEDEPVLAGQAWLVATPNRGAYFCKTDDVDAWPDLHVAEPPPAPETPAQ